jgi:two-component system, OmpR family, response regulator RstA
MNQSKKSILLVEDDLRLSNLVKEYLKKQDYEVNVEHNGEIAVNRILTETPDLVILDLMLPGKDGLSVCRSVRSSYHGPILILTAKEDDMDQVAGLELGADDYVKKPVEPRVLLARIRALFRRSQGLPPEDKKQNAKINKYCFGSLSIDLKSRNVLLNNKLIDLSTTEFDLLSLLVLKSGEILDRDYLYNSIKGIEYDGIDRAIDVAVSRLRKKLNDNPEHPYRIKTVWGSGYLFVEDAWE